jgi:hypothetical protein
MHLKDETTHAGNGIKIWLATHFQIDLKFSRKYEFCSIRNNSREKNRQVGVETSL